MSSLSDPATRRVIGDKAPPTRDPDQDRSIRPTPLLAQSNGATHEPTLSPFHELVEQHAADSPLAPAVSGQDRMLTFAELDESASQLAHYLRSLGVGPDVLVALFFPRTTNLVVGLLGVLKAGGAYVPCDPDYPSERIRIMLADSKPAVVLTELALRDRLPETAVQVLCLDEAWPLPASQTAAQRDELPRVLPSQLAYIIYTSGSTGKPKGVMIEHGGLSNYLVWAAEYYDVASGAGAPVQSSSAFDLTVTSLLVPLSVGRSVVLIPEQSGPEGLGHALQRDADFSLAKLTPAHLDILARQVPPETAGGRVRALVIGGEQLRAEQLRFWRKYAPDTRLINEYGPTETVVGCCIYEVQPDDPDSGPVPIGQPIANTHLYVFDELRHEVPLGMAGELYIGGAGIARGYLNQPDLTAERFLDDPFAPGSRMYKTGDLVRYRADGMLEFLGRIDDQVKIRGFRVEPGEVEVALVSQPGVRDAAVVAREHSSGDRRLVAYVAADTDPAPTSTELRSHLLQRLPDYMVPTAWVFLDELPLTINGKVDRKRLPSAERVPIITADQVPQDPLEVQLAQLWQAALEVPHVGLRDNFFDLGGYSLLAVNIFAEIEAIMARKLPISMLFEAPTIAELATALRQQGVHASGSCLVPIQARGTRLPFFCIHGLGGGVLDYAGVARQLSPDQPVYGIQAPEQHGQYVTFVTIEDMATYYNQQLRIFQPHGPYQLGGYSAGGIIAYEMAQQLVSEGYEVALIALFDAEPRVRPSMRLLSETVRELPYFIANLRGWSSDFRGLSAQVRIARLRRKLRAAALLLLRAAQGLGTAQEFELDDVIDDADLIPVERRSVHEMHLRALTRYFPRPYPGRLSLFRAQIQPLLGHHTTDLGWKHLARGGVDACVISGSHHTLLKEPHIAELGRALSERLDAIARSRGEDRGSLTS